MTNHSWSEGKGIHKGYFEFTLIPNTNVNVFKNFIHGNKHTIDYNLSYA